MFKIFFITLAAALALTAISCRTAPPLPQANLQEPGWQVRQGQAVWRLAHGEREIAGEVLVATKCNGPRAFVQFSKAPFPLVIGQETANRWQVDFPPQNRHYAGQGRPPQRIIWLYLPRILLGQAPPKKWSWHQDANGWRLQNTPTGESLEGFFNQ
jgi:hypothetical protein